MPVSPSVALPALLLWTVAVPLAAQTTISWSPERPTDGSLVVIRVGAGEADTVTGTLAGESLAFERTGDAWFAIGAVPVGAPGTVSGAVRVLRDGVRDSVALAVELTPARYGADTLRVDPRFTNPPDSALQARIEHEQRLVATAIHQSRERQRLWSGPFMVPRDARVTSGYGRARVFNGQVRSRHLGVDLDGDPGDPVVAANSGVVSLVGDFYYSGRIVYVDHGAGLLTAYLHLSEALVAPGDSVTRGQLIGRVGSSGRVTGPHLHWTARHGDIIVDALSLTRLDHPLTRVLPADAEAPATR